MPRSKLLATFEIKTRNKKLVLKIHDEKVLECILSKLFSVDVSISAERKRKKKVDVKLAPIKVEAAPSNGSGIPVKRIVCETQPSDGNEESLPDFLVDNPWLTVLAKKK